MARPDCRDRHCIRSGSACILLILLSVVPAMAQLGRGGADEPALRLRRPAAPRYDLIALRVEFQPDDSRFSTGDGVFGGSMFEDLEPRIDPFPHDAAYFEAHLEFLSNYVRSVSRGQTTIRTHLLPEVVRVSKTMGAYAPIGPDDRSAEQRARLVALVREAWALADAQSSFNPAGLDPNRTAFFLFHAGTGRDVELTNTTLDRTPEDLPSLFFDAAALVGDGDPVRFKNFTVTNTAVIPETESKRGVDPLSDTPFLLELSINGLMASSFFNFLGVPDLFDTSTGSSAIGPYGLMDPLGIFAYGGLLPPQPSGWTRFYLGWTNPTELSGPDPVRVDLRAHVDQAIVPVSSTEYFLAEVRHRDTGSDGLNLKVYRDGSVIEQRFEADATDFTSLNQDGFEGVLIDADDFDWALPGGFDDIDVLRNGGILIWHVDERIIADGLATNTVNVDPNRRGVDLEEADSAQDLGFPTGNIFAPDFDRGTPFDFYFEGNPVTSITATGEVALYQNRFGPDTYPDSESNGGGPSFVVLGEFSAAGTTMSLEYSRSGGATTPVDFATGSLNVPFGPGSSVSTMDLEIGPARIAHLLLHTGDETRSLWQVPLNDNPPSRLDGVVSKPAIITSSGGASTLALLIEDDTGEIFFTRFDPISFRPQIRVPLPAEVRLATPSTPLVGVQSGDQTRFYVGYDLEDEGALVSISPDLTTELIPFPLGGVTSLAALPDGVLLAVGRRGAQIRTAGEAQEWVFSRGFSGRMGQVSAGVDGLGSVAAFSVPSENVIVILNPDARVVELRAGAQDLSQRPILFDADDDGFLDVVVTAGSQLLAFSREGAVASYFPVRLPAPAETQPLTATFDDDGAPHLVLSLSDGYLYAYRPGRRATTRTGFPLAVGGTEAITPLIINDYIYTVSSTGSLAGWNVDGLAPAGWSMLYGDPLNRSFLDGGGDPPASPGDGSLIVDGETYNWPNPVRDGVTRLRVATRERASLAVTIIDLAGNLVHELAAEIQTPGVPIEFEWRPLVESGVYFARISAETPSGDSDTKLYPIAVIR